VDSEADAALRDRYALRIPVLRVGEAELDAAGLDDAALARWLDEIAPLPILHRQSTLEAPSATRPLSGPVSRGS